MYIIQYICVCAHTGSETPSESNPPPSGPDQGSATLKTADANPSGRLPATVC